MINCEREYCEDKQTPNSEGADYGMCDDHFAQSNWYCEACKAVEGQWCDHKRRA